MMDNWKYVLLDMSIGGTVIIIFPPVVSHADVAKGFHGSEAVSAGFVRFDESKQELICYGKSESLGLSSDPEDSVYANYLLHPR